MVTAWLPPFRPNHIEVVDPLLAQISPEFVPRHDLGRIVPGCRAPPLPDKPHSRAFTALSLVEQRLPQARDEIFARKFPPHPFPGILPHTPAPLGIFEQPSYGFRNFRAVGRIDPKPMFTGTNKFRGCSVSGPHHWLPLRHRFEEHDPKSFTLCGVSLQFGPCRHGENTAALVGLA